MAAQVGKNRSLCEWHRALGHLNVHDLRLLLKSKDIIFRNENFECKSCLLAKMTRQPHSSQEIRSSHVLELVHTDLSGIIRTPSIGNFRYFLSFIDDYSRYATVYLLKSKEEVLEKFTVFKALVENKFDCKIKSLRYDNGTEYINERFGRLLISN